eukprot:SAG31_NODE_9049_length_1343_cov_1.037781_2_plen_175_part_00
MAGLIKQFDNMEPVKEPGTDAIVANNPNRYIDDDETFRARVHSLFNRIDRDKDYNLTSTELTRSVTHIHRPALARTARRDSKRENLLLIRYINDLDDPSIKVPSNLDFQFQKYDTNGNGTIDKDELAGLIRGLGLEDMVPNTEEVRSVLMLLCISLPRTTSNHADTVSPIQCLS